VELRGANPGREAPQALDHSWESRAGLSFEDFLARELHQNLNGDIVRHASVALRDGGEGTIRLALRPESLGNVKIRLEMAENKVTGHIIVESEAAFRAFEREVSSLEQAFRDSGFDAADLDMSLDGGTERGWNGEEPDRPSLPKQLAALRYDTAFERLEQAAGEARTGIFTQNGRIAVNMLV
jgi:flagellar hook-length control protein FliK